MYVVEAALIFEAGKEADYDVIVMVDAPHERCVERVMRARGLSREEVERIARSQIPAGEKRKRAQIVIENDGAIEDLEEEARKVFRSLMDMERKENRG
jgi:dephospho-CoA kinase